VVLAVSVLLAVVLTLLNVRGLQVNIADPQGPPLWLGAMLLLLLGAIAASGPIRGRLPRPSWPLALLAVLLAYAAVIRFVALATASGLSLQNGRLIAETIPTALLWVISIGAFLEGARTGRPWAFAVAGMGGGLGLYFYPSARLWAVGAMLTVAVIWLFEWRG